MADVSAKKPRKETSPPLYETLDNVYLCSADKAVTRLVNFLFVLLPYVAQKHARKIFVSPRVGRLASGIGYANILNMIHERLLN